MRKAKVFLAEDNQPIRELENRIVTLHGHTVEVEASSLKEALSSIKLAQEKGVNVAVLDGCLTDGPWRNDGKVIAQALKKAIPEIKIIFCSGMLLEDGDVNLLKENAGTLGKVIDKL